MEWVQHLHSLVMSTLLLELWVEIRWLVEVVAQEEKEQDEVPLVMELVMVLTIPHNSTRQERLDLVD